MSEWEYNSFYFGNAMYPSVSIWRRNKETGERQRLVYATAGEESVLILRRWWDGVRSERTVDPHYVIQPKRPILEIGEDPNWYALRYWFTFPDDEAAEVAWQRDVECSLGGPASTWHYDKYAALYEEDEQ